MLFVAWAWVALLGNTGLQEPARCAFARDVNGGPYCLAAAYADQLERMASAYRAAQDSAQAAAIAGARTRSMRPLARAFAYWGLEKRRIARDGCRRLSEFEVGADSLGAGLLVEGYCGFVALSATHDSIMIAKTLARIEATEAGRAPPALASEATEEAEAQQRAEEITRVFLVLSTAWTHLLVESEGSSGSRLALTPIERRSLGSLMRRAAAVGRGGMFAQTGKMLGEWLGGPEWRTRPAKAR